MPLVQGCLLAHAVFLDDPCLNAHNGTLDVESRPSARHVPTRPPILYGSYSVDGSCDREGRMEDSRARRADIDDGMRSLSGDDCIVSRSKRLFAGPDVTSGRPLFPVNDPRRHLHRSSTCPADKTNSTGPYSAEDDAERPVTGMSGRETRAVMVYSTVRHSHVRRPMCAGRPVLVHPSALVGCARRRRPCPRATITNRRLKPTEDQASEQGRRDPMRDRRTTAHDVATKSETRRHEHTRTMRPCLLGLQRLRCGRASAFWAPHLPSNY